MTVADICLWYVICMAYVSKENVYSDDEDGAVSDAVSLGEKSKPDSSLLVQKRDHPSRRWVGSAISWWKSFVTEKWLKFSVTVYGFKIELIMVILKVWNVYMFIS